MLTVAIVILAAGASRRMAGRDKCLEPVDGRPLIQRQAERAQRAAKDVFVTIPDANHPRAAALANLGVTLVPVPDADEGMSASIKAAIAVLPERCDAAMILPADMPDIDTADLATMIDTYEAGTLLRATTPDGHPGHPVIFPQHLFGSLRQLSGDEGARSVVAANSKIVKTCVLPGERALTDLDTPDAWDAWRRARS